MDRSDSVCQRQLIKKNQLDVSVVSINKAIIVGNLGRSPEVSALPSGQNVANFSVATKARLATADRTEFLRFAAQISGKTLGS